MDQVNCTFIKKVLPFLIGSLKLILFLGSFILLIFSVLNFVILIKESRNGLLDALPRSGVQYKLYVINSAMTIVSLIGIYGSYYSHQASLKTFAGFAGGNVLLIMLIVGRSGIQIENEKYFKKLDVYQEYYNWTETEIMYNKDDILLRRIKEATENWNGLQKYGCCGIHNHNEWDSFRPENLSANLYPKTCCGANIIQQTLLAQTYWFYTSLLYKSQQRYDTKQYCNIDLDAGLFHKIGCHDKVVQIEGFIFGLLSIFVGIQIVLAIDASFLAYHETTNRDTETSIHNNVSAQLAAPIPGNVWQLQPFEPTNKDQLPSAPQYPNIGLPPNYYPNPNTVTKI